MTNRRVVKIIDLRVKSPTIAVTTQAMLVLLHVPGLIGVAQFSLDRTDLIYARLTLSSPYPVIVSQLRSSEKAEKTFMLTDQRWWEV